ncbi:MAG TPA: hypothetical protein VGQ52_03585 [Gemmatimonadaceae bacterium]|jgi:hypothetical protein|nr:hypothetical protein [Gemmatimonadaceae bacterium]
MRPRVRLIVFATLAVATACIGRGRPPQPAQLPPTVIPIDTGKRPAVDTSRPKPPEIIPVVDSAVKGAPPRPAGETAPGQRCILDVVGPDESRAQLVKNPTTGKYVTYVGGGITGRCRRQDIVITADSAETYEDNRVYYLVGNVKYREKRINLDADRLSYFGADERLLLENNVRATLPSGTTMKATTSEYFRAIRGMRPTPRLIGRGRPTIDMIEKDSLGKEGAPVNLVADLIIAEGDSLFYASKNVVLTRTDLVAKGDSAFVDNGRQYARLMLKPIIESKGSEPYTLKGRAIDIYARNRQAERVVSQDSGIAVSKQLTLTADTIDMRVNQQKLQRAFAFGRRAHATTPERDIFADSLHVVMPNQRIREFWAVGQGYAESDPDSTKIKSDERDWLRGDTIHALFDSLAAGDTTSRPPIKLLVATSNAASYYQVPPNDSTLHGKPAINYVRGRIIEVEFAKDEARLVKVIDQASGVYLEPANPADSARANSNNTRPRPGTRPPTRPPRPPE